MSVSKVVRPAAAELIRLTVLRTERLAPSWMRVTLGGGEIDRFTPMGYDQWFRLFLPVSGESALQRVPAKANRLFGYLRFLGIPDGERPVMRNYSVREYRPASAAGGAEIDVDFLLHGTGEDDTAGPASWWARTCAVGDSVLMIDEGISFNPSRGEDRVVLVSDAAGLPALSSICASVPHTATGVAVIELSPEEDAVPFPHPAGLDVHWLVRSSGDAPGACALAALRKMALPDEPVHAWVGGEQSLASGVRRHLVRERGIDRHAVSFTGYWRRGVAAPASSSAREAASRA